MAEEIGFENGRNSNFQRLVTMTLTLDPAIRHTVVHHSSTSTYIRNFIEIGRNFFFRKSPLRFYPSSKSLDTKTRTNIKNPARSNWILCCSLRISGHLPARSHCKWRRRKVLKMEGIQTFKGSWPWPWPWIRPYGIPSCITHRPLPMYQISFKSKKLFVDGRT